VCQFWELNCKVGEVAAVAMDNIIAQWAQSIMEGVSASLIRVGTFWTAVGTPDLGSGGAVAFVTSKTAWLVVAVAIASIMVAGIQIAWTRRGEPARDLLRSLITLVVTSGVGVGAAQLAVTASDDFAKWIMDSVSTGNGGNFAAAIIDISSLNLEGFSMMVIIVAGLLGVVANVIQIGLMWVRSAMLILLAGMVPLAGAATNTKWGAQWLEKALAWFVAFAAFKPAASIVYAVAVKLMAGRPWGDGDQMVQFIMGVMMMVMAVFALPALMSFIVPATAAIGGGGSVANAIGAVAATGAAPIVRQIGGGGAGSESGGRGAAGRDGQQGPSGASGSSQAESSGPARPGGGRASAGAGGGGAGVGAAGSGSGAAAASGGGAAGAAAGPAGLAVGAAAGAGRKAVEAGVSAVQAGAAQTGPTGADPARSAGVPSSSPTFQGGLVGGASAQGAVEAPAGGQGGAPSGPAVGGASSNGPAVQQVPSRFDAASSPASGAREETR
jgi:hypothetical protein